MGKLNLGILGGFTGKVGTVIGTSNRKGDDIIRAKSKKPRPASTEAQVKQQTKFGLVTGFVKSLNPVISIGLKQVAGAEKISAHNYASRYLLNNAITGTPENPEIDFSKVIVSEGKLSRIIGLTVEKTEDGVKFNWPAAVEAGIGQPGDQVIPVVLNVDKAELNFSTEGAIRSATTYTLSYPYAETNDRLLCYLFFRSATDPLLVSTSQYLGTLIAD